MAACKRQSKSSTTTKRCPLPAPPPPPPSCQLPLQDATVARDAALEKLKVAEARIATDMHAVNARHSAQSTTLAACTSDRVALLEAMREVTKTN